MFLQRSRALMSKNGSDPTEQAKKKPLFRLGRVVATPGAAEALEAADETAAQLLARHQYGNWGDVPPEDAAANEASVKQGLRIISAYTLSTGVTVWVITEANRSATTFLLPEEY
jgi:hypothetical protein